MALFTHDIYIPMEAAPLLVMTIPAIYQGKHLNIHCDDPIQREVYLLTNGKMTGPYRSGQKANNGITWTAQFFGNECLLLCVNKGALSMEVPVPMNPVMAVLPTGQAIDVLLTCKASVGFHVDDPEALIDGYRNSRFTDAEALIYGTLSQYLKTKLAELITKLAMSHEMPLVLSSLQIIAASLCDAARMHLNRLLEGLHIHWVDIDLTCTNVDEIIKTLNTPKSTLPPEVITLLQTILSNPALNFDQQNLLLDRLCQGPYKYDAKQLQQAAQNLRYLT